MSNSIERRQARRMERWTELESFDGEETSTEKITEEQFYETGAIKARRVIERTNTRNGRYERQSTRELGSEEGWTKEPTSKALGGSARREEPEQIEEQGVGGRLASGAWKLAKRGFNEVMWGKS